MQRRLFLSSLIYADQVIYNAGQQRMVYARHASELRFSPRGKTRRAAPPSWPAGFLRSGTTLAFRCDATSDSWPGYSHPGTIEFSNRIVGILHDCLKGRRLYSEQTAWGHHHKTKSCLTSDPRWACNG